MNTPFNLTDDMLWDLADGLISGEEKTRLEAYLDQNQAAKQQFQAVLNEKKNLAHLTLDAPRVDFAQQVMAAWVAEQPQLVAQKSNPKSRDWILWALLLAMGVVFLIPFWFGSSTTSPSIAVQIPDEYTLNLDFFKVNLEALASLAWFRNLSILVLAYMGLMVLDKWFLYRVIVKTKWI